MVLVFIEMLGGIPEVAALATGKRARLLVLGGGLAIAGMHKRVRAQDTNPFCLGSAQTGYAWAEEMHHAWYVFLESIHWKKGYSTGSTVLESNLN